MSDIRLNLPATVIGPLTNLRDAKVLATATHMWIVAWENGTPYLANHFPIVSIERARRGERSYTVTDDQGQSWLIVKGCGCGSPAKSFNVPSYLNSIGVTL